MLGVAEGNGLGDSDDFLNDFVFGVFGFFALNVFVVGDFDLCAFSLGDFYFNAFV